jgi:hypothetical protein
VLKEQDPDFHGQGLGKLILQYDTCLSFHVDYLEKSSIHETDTSYNSY